VLAHGVAHTALHSPTRQQVRQALITVATSMPATIPVFTCTSQSSFPITSGVLQTDEFSADYFGVQCLYKSGYDPECYLRFVQRIWPAGPGSNVPVAFSQFPPSVERLKTIRNEIAGILPPREQLVVSRCRGRRSTNFRRTSASCRLRHQNQIDQCCYGPRRRNEVDVIVRREGAGLSAVQLPFGKWFAPSGRGSAHRASTF
jgi:predicted Zn-dependent protease